MDVERQLPAEPISRDQLVVATPDVGNVPLGAWATSVSWETTTSTTATLTINVAEQNRRDLIDAYEAFFSPDANGVERVKKWNTIRLYGTEYVLCEFTRDQGTFGLAFYDAASERLKQFQRARKISRSQATQAEFIVARCTEAGVESFSPGEHDKQPIADLAPADIKTLHQAAASAGNTSFQLSQRDAKQAGLATLRQAANQGVITIKGAKPDNHQLRNLAIALTVADAEGAVGKARIALIVDGIGESSFRAVPNAGGSPYGGVFQGQIRATGNGPAQFSLNDTEQQAHYFLRGGKGYQGGGAMYLARHHPDWTPGHISFVVGGDISNFGYDEAKAAAFYDQWRNEADAILTAWSPGDTGQRSVVRAGSPDRAYVQRFEYTTSRQENYWEAFDRLAQLVNWRRFAVFNTLVYANDVRLSLLAPYDFSEIDPWVDGEPSWKCTAAEKVDEVQGSGRLAALIPAGSAFACSDKGPTYGTWLVRQFKRSDLLDESCPVEFTLGRAQAPLAEPASTVVSVPGTAPSTDNVGLVKPAPGRTYKSITTRPDGKVVPPKFYLVEFLKELAGAVGHTVYVNTYSDHNQESSTGTGQSEHWTGNAGDLYVAGIDTKLGHDLCFAAIQLCGDSVAHPKKTAVEVIAERAARDGTKSVGDGWEHFPWVHVENRNGVSAQITYSVQIIWKAPDGSHHDHVHVGIHPKLPGERLFSF